MKRFFNRARNIFSLKVQFVLGMYVILLTLFSLTRVILLLRNSIHAQQIPLSTLAESFLVGLRFDLAVSSYLLIPLLFVLLVLRDRKKLRWTLCVFSLLIAIVFLMGLAEADFYRELESRYNGLVFEYLSHPEIVAGMIWDGYPVVHYILLWVFLMTCYGLGVWWLDRGILQKPYEPCRTRKILMRASGTMVFLAMMIFTARGGFASEPLRWGDAYFSNFPFANHLALNGFYTLGRSALDKIYDHSADWTHALANEEAERITREMVMLPNEADLSSSAYPLLRRENQAISQNLLHRISGRPINVVVILMESFSARFVGALGSDFDLTPEFNRLAQEGILFERAFSNGTHTHQGVFVSLCSFPNLPGYEYLMKMMEGNQAFSSLPSILSREHYQTLFMYNGLFSWDNKKGFFQQHGMERFIGTKDYINPTFVDPVWGVSDYDVFMRANQEFKSMAPNGPFLSVILTLSNHSPFNLPDPLPFERIKTGGALKKRYNAMRYADWALGEFFRKARKEPYFENTLFVLTGDHGFGSLPIITEMQLEHYHVPLLFYAPGLLKEKGVRRQTVASHLDIVPTILGLLELETPHQAWGRDLFATTPGDQGFAVIKPSGGENRVALIRGDYVLIEAPREKPLLYHYSLGFPPAGTPIPSSQEPEQINRMEKELLSYVETGILSLRQRRVGLPTITKTTVAKHDPVLGEILKLSEN